MRLNYFAYGSNMLPERLRRRVPSAVLIGPAVLEGHRLAFHKRSRDGSGKCDIVPTADSTVWGALFHIAGRDRRALDRAEGFGYLRLNVQVFTASAADALRAFTYRARAGAIDVDLRPYDWYHQLVVRGAEWLDLPDDYLNELRGQAQYPDPNRGRARRHHAIVRASERRARHYRAGFYKMRKRERHHAG